MFLDNGHEKATKNKQTKTSQVTKSALKFVQTLYVGVSCARSPSLPRPSPIFLGLPFLCPSPPLSSPLPCLPFPVSSSLSLFPVSSSLSLFPVPPVPLSFPCLLSLFPDPPCLRLSSLHCAAPLSVSLSPVLLPVASLTMGKVICPAGRHGAWQANPLN